MKNREELDKITKYLITGAVSTVVDFGLNFILIVVMTMSPNLESIVTHTISFIAGNIVGFFMYKNWVFNWGNKSSGKRTAIAFSLVTIFNTVWSSFGIWILVLILELINFTDNYDIIQTLGKVLIGPPLSVVGYILFKKYVFRKV